MDMLVAAHWKARKSPGGHDACGRPGVVRLAVAVAVIAAGFGLLDHAGRQGGGLSIASSDTSTQQGSEP